MGKLCGGGWVNFKSRVRDRWALRFQFEGGLVGCVSYV